MSVVVPTFNRAQHLARLLEALSSCDTPAGGCEVIVVDDGSTDMTREVAHGARIPVIYEYQPNRGPAAARNRGWRTASASIVAFIDDDCVPDRRWLVELIRAMDNDASIVGVGGAIIPATDGWLAKFVTADRLVDHGRDVDGVRFLVTANAAYRRDALAAVDGFDEAFPSAAGEDTDLSYRIRGSVGPLAVCDTALVRHEHRSSLREVLRTYYRHGRARVRLAALHKDLDLTTGGRRAVGPAAWRDRYRRYRGDGAGVTTAAAYLLLRAVGLACFLAGTLVERRT